MHIPWTRLGNTPIEVKFHTVEIVVTPLTEEEKQVAKEAAAAKAKQSVGGPNDESGERSDLGVEHATASTVVTGIASSSSSSSSSSTTTSLSNDIGSTDDSHTSSRTTEPSWIQNLLKKALANVSMSAENAVLKLDDGEVVLSAALRSLRIASADPAAGWQPKWRELFGPYQVG